MIPLPNLPSLARLGPAQYETFQALSRMGMTAKDVLALIAANGGAVSTVGLLKADGTTPLTGAWNAGQNITAPGFVGALTGNASTASTAGTVTTAAQPTITSVGSSLQVGGATTALNAPIQWSSGVIPLAVSGVLFTQTADSTTTAGSATTLLGTGVGTLTLPANLLMPGRTIRIVLSGKYGQVTTDAGGGAKTFAITLGGVTVATGTSVSYGIPSVVAFSAEATITCRSAGASGTVVGNGNWQVTVPGQPYPLVVYATGTAATVNTTGTLVINATMNNSGTGDMTTHVAVVTILN